MTIPPKVLDGLIETLDWMLKYFQWANDECGLGAGNYSPELQKAMDLLDLLKRIKMENEDGQQ
jgi:hypothetical protein